MTELPTTDELLRPGEARGLMSRLLGMVVPVSTFGGWVRAGHIEAAIRTKGGHRRFRSSHIRAVIDWMLSGGSDELPGSALA